MTEEIKEHPYVYTIIGLVAEFLPPKDLKQLRLVNSTCPSTCRLQLAKTTEIVLTDDLAPNKKKSESDAPAGVSPHRRSRPVSEFMSTSTSRQSTILLMNFALEGWNLFSNASFGRFKPFLRDYALTTREFSSDINWAQIPVANMIKFVNQTKNLTTLKLKIKFPKKWHPVDIPEDGLAAVPNNMKLCLVSIQLVEGGDLDYSYRDLGNRSVAYKNLVDTIFKYYPTFKTLRYHSPGEPVGYSRESDYSSYKEDIAFLTACKPHLERRRYVVVDFQGIVEYERGFLKNFRNLLEENNVRPPSLRINVNHFQIGGYPFDLIKELEFHRGTLQSLALSFAEIYTYRPDRRKPIFILPISMGSLKTFEISFASCGVFQNNPITVLIQDMNYDNRLPLLEELVIRAPIYIMKDLCNGFLSPCQSLKRLELNSSDPDQKNPFTPYYKKLWTEKVRKVFPNLVWLGSDGCRWGK